MAFDQHTNFAYSTVQSGSGVIGSTTGTTINIVNTADLPDPTIGAYNVTVWPSGASPTSANAEIMRVTAKSGTTLTVTRAQEATAALAAIAAGYQVALAMTSKLLTDIEAVAGTGGGGGGGAALLATGTVSGGKITFASIAQTYKLLVIYAYLRDTGGGGPYQRRYPVQRRHGGPTTPACLSGTTGSSTGAVAYGMCGFMPDSTAAAGKYGFCRVEIPFYSQSTAFITAGCQSDEVVNANGGPQAPGCTWSPTTLRGGRHRRDRLAGERCRDRRRRPGAPCTGCSGCSARISSVPPTSGSRPPARQAHQQRSASASSRSRCSTAPPGTSWSARKRSRC